MNNGNGDDIRRQRRLIPDAYLPGKFAQTDAPRAPFRAVRIKGHQLRAKIYSPKDVDWGDIYGRYVDLWQEARMVIWRAKHAKAGPRTYDPDKGKEILSFVADDKLVLEAVNTVKNVLDSMVRLRRDMTVEGPGIPRWAISKIEEALREHPDALEAILEALAKGEE